MRIKVDKEELLGKLRDNRTAHGEAFATALEGYKIEARAELEEKLALLEAGEPFDRFLEKSPPEDHTSDYDTVIEMLEMDVNDVVDLDQSQFVQYVKDDWGWKRNWTVANTGYITTAGA